MTASVPLFPPVSPDALQPLMREAFGACAVWRTPGCVDLLMFSPTPERPQYLLLTCGASAAAASLDDPAAGPEFGLLLDRNWPVDQIGSPEAMWPLRLLTQVGNLVLSGQSLGTGFLLKLDAALPGTAFTHVLVSPTIAIDRSALLVDGRMVVLYSLLPCYEPEVQFTHGRPLGGITLISRFLDAELSELVQVGRPMVISASEQVQRVLSLN